VVLPPGVEAAQDHRSRATTTTVAVGSVPITGTLSALGRQVPPSVEHVLHDPGALAARRTELHPCVVLMHAAVHERPVELDPREDHAEPRVTLQSRTWSSRFSGDHTSSMSRNANIIPTATASPPHSLAEVVEPIEDREDHTHMRIDTAHVTHAGLFIPTYANQ